jgi:hypothetical protein
MSTVMRPIARWMGLALVVAISVLGLQSAVSGLDSAETGGQEAATAAQFGYALTGLLAAGALLSRRSWARRPLWLWAGLVTLTAGMAPVVWSGAGLGVGFAAGAAFAAITAVVIWLATR